LISFSAFGVAMYVLFFLKDYYFSYVVSVATSVTRLLPDDSETNQSRFYTSGSIKHEKKPGRMPEGIYTAQLLHPACIQGGRGKCKDVLFMRGKIVKTLKPDLTFCVEEDLAAGRRQCC